MRRSKKCPMCSSSMQRLYVKEGEKLVGIAWWCKNCSNPEQAFVVYDEDLLDKFESLVRGARIKLKGKSIRDSYVCRGRSVYIRQQGAGWRTVGFLQLRPQLEIILEDYLLGPRPKNIAAPIQNREDVVTSPIVVAAYALKCDCGRSYIFDIDKRRILVSKDGYGFGKIGRGMHVHSVWFRCYKCGKKRKVANLIKGKLEISCDCGAKGILDISEGKIVWLPIRPTFELRNVTLVVYVNEPLNLNALSDAIQNQKIQCVISPNKLIAKLIRPKATLSIFNSGKIVCTSTSEENAKLALNFLIKHVKRAVPSISGNIKIKVKSKTISTRIPHMINIDNLYASLERLRIPAKIDKNLKVIAFEDNSLSFKITEKGVVICKGAKPEREIINGIFNMLSKLNISLNA